MSSIRVLLFIAALYAYFRTALVSVSASDAPMEYVYIFCATCIKDRLWNRQISISAFLILFHFGSIVGFAFFFFNALSTADKSAYSIRLRQKCTSI